MYTYIYIHPTYTSPYSDTTFNLGSIAVLEIATGLLVVTYYYSSSTYCSTTVRCNSCYSNTAVKIPR